MTTDIKLGTIPTTKNIRDAIHIAIVSIEAGETLKPGERVGVATDGCAYGRMTPVGIVDPFLDHVITTGEMFYLLMNQGSTSKMVHHWTHPILDQVKQLAPPSTKSEYESGSVEEVDNGCRGCY